MSSRRAWAVGVAWVLAVGCGGKTDLFPQSVNVGAASGSGSGTGSGSGVSDTGCAALQQCCATSLPETSLVGCEMLVATGDPSECNEALAELHDVGYCGSTGTGSGFGSGSGGPETTDCKQLGDCCSQLPEATQGECQTIAQANEDPNCASAITSLQGAGFCRGDAPPPTDPCTQLAPCCKRFTLTMEEVLACEETATSGDDAACESAAQTYCTE